MYTVNTSSLGSTSTSNHRPETSPPSKKRSPPPTHHESFSIPAPSTLTLVNLPPHSFQDLFQRPNILPQTLCNPSHAAAFAPRPHTRRDILFIRTQKLQPCSETSVSSVGGDAEAVEGMAAAILVLMRVDMLRSDGLVVARVRFGGLAFVL